MNTAPLPRITSQKTRSYTNCSFETAQKIIRQECGNVFVAERHGKGDNKVLILPEATKEFKVLVSYGRRAPMNHFEQKFIGMGHFMLDENGNNITVISHFIQIHTTNRSAVGASNLLKDGQYNHGLDFLEYYREEYLRSESEFNTDEFGCTVDPFIKICGSSMYVLEGHTHPDLGVFFSSTDISTGKARAGTSPLCIFVCDPIRKTMLAGIGKDFKSAEIVVYSSDKPQDKKIDRRGRYYHLSNVAETLFTLSGKCLQTPGYTGKAKLHRRLDGRDNLRINIIFPKHKRKE